ncbi:N-acetylglucosamine-6-phosphate deacetylase [Bacillus sp. DNRA2]|uniref:N-acetylglucosamine-6-phosphate deacetylase n=1 Tax=Bacillus sp. DNRA2 TaxID=2723053 RepID=UPI00145D92D2|nr:N-acetylglucosamine-6-phosphate deacetylase [Bacillus sp. DNRA2]NMD70058.1 N-acetylglucosamine-6-phosphate deacetylase [Bacillus sp. DNRA2]
MGTLHNHRTLFKNVQIYTETNMIVNGYIKTNNTKIIEIGSMNDLKDEDEFEIVELPSNYTAIPGLIDMHIHGVSGADTMDGTYEALETMVTALPQEGTTSFLATTMTQAQTLIEKALLNAGQYINAQPAQGCAEILGIHLEGPFVNPKMAGAQPIQHIVDPNLSLFNKWQDLSRQTIKQVTIAPEQSGGLELIRHFKKTGIIASIGHSNATYDDMDEAIAAGANQLTHLYNQMRPLHHREPGVVGAAFLRKELKAEIICDGIHARPEMVKLAYQQKHSDGLILITDAMRAKCLKNGQYDLGGQTVTVTDGKAVLHDGTIAGSVLKLGQALKNIIGFTGCSLAEAIEMASVNPAKQLNLFDRKGSLAVGKDADIVILDDQLEVFMTFCRGKLGFKKQ